MLGNWLSESPAPKIPTFVAVKKEWDMSKGGGGRALGDLGNIAGSSLNPAPMLSN